MHVIIIYQAGAALTEWKRKIETIKKESSTEKSTET